MVGNGFTYCYFQIQEVLKHKALWINQITAASREHDLKYPVFVVNSVPYLKAWMSMKTFKSGAALAKRRQQQGFAAAFGNEKEPESLFS
ncbi:hypothetical protein H1C71_006421, partial [Ictidomys tridecemlineatus]|uniref:Uncharacterized protein n=1 Tax=Ictidomys tridecemlineatus TaxID=43179 RepID=A0A287CZV7_ICTTR